MGESGGCTAAEPSEGDRCIAGDVGGRRKCKGTAVGDSVDRTMDERREREASFSSSVTLGDDGLLWDSGAESTTSSPSPVTPAVSGGISARNDRSSSVWSRDNFRSYTTEK